MKTSLFASLVALCLLSCKPRPASVATVEAGYTLKAHGITYQVPSQKFAVVADSGGDYSYTGETLSFSVKSGKLTVNGKDSGTVKAGDTVTIDKTGAVSINGESQTSK